MRREGAEEEPERWREALESRGLKVSTIEDGVHVREQG